jgi:hypothetical protein
MVSGKCLIMDVPLMEGLEAVDLAVVVGKVRRLPVEAMRTAEEVTTTRSEVQQDKPRVLRLHRLHQAPWCLPVHSGNMSHHQG